MTISTYSNYYFKRESWGTIDNLGKISGESQLKHMGSGDIQELQVVSFGICLHIRTCNCIWPLYWEFNDGSDGSDGSEGNDGSNGSDGSDGSLMLIWHGMTHIFNMAEVYKDQ